MTLGVACKKSNEVADSKPATELKKEVSLKLPKPAVLGDAKGGNTVEDPDQGFPTGKEAFPHNTGLCTCGCYDVCHPDTYWARDRNGVEHLYITGPNQTTFPTDARFPGNTPE